MIKCDYFGKLLKQGFFILLISCFILLGGSFVNGATILKNGQYYPSNLDNAIDINVNNKGQLMSQRLGTTKRVLSFISNDSQKVFFWRGPLQRPYIIVQRPYRTVSQGYVKTYYLCDELTQDSSFFSNCTPYSIDNNFGNEFSSFFNSITINDYWGYDVYARNCASYYQQLVNQVCFSSSQFHKSICFSNGVGSIGGGCFCENCYDTTGSLNIDINRQFTAIPDEYIGTPPGFNYGGSSEGSAGITIDINIITGDYLYRSCTYGEILKRLESDGYSNYFCYGGLDNFDLYDPSVNYNVVPGTGKSLAQILAYSQAWDTPQEWYEFWNGLYQDKNNPSYISMWSSYPAVYRTWFELYYQYGGYQDSRYFDYVREYCAMKSLNIDPSTIYNGKYFQGVCDTINDEIQYGSSSGSGTAIGVNWNGIGNMGGEVKSNAVSFIQDFFNLAKSKVPTDFTGNSTGFLPIYIIVFLCGIILFRFISH